jgi:Na+/H+ antiporter NhaD/arsenite permease-like protein
MMQPETSMGPMKPYGTAFWNMQSSFFFCKEALHFNIMERVSRAEWDTLLFFYGVILCVGGIAQFGYLGISHSMYTILGFTYAFGAHLKWMPAMSDFFTG